MRFPILVSCLALVCATAAQATPDPTPDSSAAVVRVRTDCGSAPDNDNCFESMAALSGSSTSTSPWSPTTSSTNTGWIWTTRNPSGVAPLVVDVGPGNFEPFACPKNLSGPMFGYVTVQGAGRDETTLGSNSVPIGFDGYNCTQLVVRDLTAKGTTYAVRWTDGGDASWYNVAMIADSASLSSGSSFGWIDDCFGGGQHSRSFHNLVGCYAETTGQKTSQNYAYYSGCAETWFTRGEIAAYDGASRFSTGLKVTNGSIFQAAESLVRVEGEDVVWGTDREFVAIVAVGAGTAVHWHGGSIRATANAGVGMTNDVDVVGFDVDTNAFGDTEGVSWALDAPDGAATQWRGAGQTCESINPARSPMP